MAPGILDTLAVAAAFAAPLALFGLNALLSGDPLGAAFLALAALFVAVQHVLTMPQDLLGSALQRAAGAVVEDPDDD
ncbi:MAG: hypothetical protein ABEJ04_03230 [Halobacteriaceae archaeon]